MRLLSINPNRFNIDNTKKIAQMIKYCMEWQIDIILIAETNAKQISKTKEKLRFKMLELERNIEMIYADSGEHNKAKKNYLPSCIINSI